MCEIIFGIYKKFYVFLIYKNIYGIFLNIIIEFQNIIIGIKDLVGKMIGILTTLLYVLDGSSKTVESAWNGPSGQLVRSLGNCFHPNTKLKLENGKIELKNYNIKKNSKLDLFKG